MLPRESFYPGFWWSKKNGAIAPKPGTIAIHHMGNTWIEHPWEKELGELGRSWWGRSLLLIAMIQFIVIIVGTSRWLKRRVVGF
jgi:hypothetical protein